MQEVRKELQYGTNVIDWQTRINPEDMRRERLAKVRAAMKEHGIGALLLNGAENRRYAACMRGGPGTFSGAFTLVFLDDIVGYEEGPIWLPEKPQISWIKPENYRPIDPIWGNSEGREFVLEHFKGISKRIKQDLKDHHMEKEQLGVDILGTPQKIAFEELGVKTMDAYDLMMECRIIKTENEIKCMKMSGAIADIAWAEMIEAMRPGRRECEIAAVGYAALVRNNVETVFGITLRSGPNTAPNYMGRMPTDRIIQAGDMVFSDMLFAGFMGYRTCYYRTFKVGTKPTQQEKDWFKKCREDLYRAVEGLRDGVTSADVAALWPTAKDFGYENEGVASGAAFGHGIGLSQYEYPIISRYNSFRFPQPIKKNMTIAMETWAGQLDIEHGWRGGARLENIWLVTEKGSENLYGMPDEEIICPPHAIYY